MTEQQIKKYLVINFFLMLIAIILLAIHANMYPAGPACLL